jgi:hypothetical protein
MKRIGLALVLGLVTAASASAQQRGDWVLARWQNGAYWFPGVIENRAGSNLTIAYDDGTRETVALSQIRPYDWALGTRVQCQWKGGTEWYSGKITAISRDGVTIDVAYDDGDREQTRTGACRAQ